jgi:hypothetical protein
MCQLVMIAQMKTKTTLLCVAVASATKMTTLANKISLLNLRQTNQQCEVQTSSALPEDSFGAPELTRLGDKNLLRFA